MVDFEIVKAQMRSLIASANATTGNTDTNLTDGVNALIGGYGSGGSSGGAELNIHYGDTAPEDISKLWCKCDKPSSVLGKSKVDGAENINTSSTSLPIGLNSMGVGVVGTKMYIFGGYTGSERKNTIHVFDIETETITTLSTTLPNVLSSMGVGVVGTKVYIFGGYVSNQTNAIHVFDTETETITTLSATLPIRASDIGVATVGTKIYIFGGHYKASNTDTRLNTINVFDTETETITTLSTTLPAKIYSMGIEVVGTKIYIFGGYAGEYRTAIHVFDTETETITTLSTALPDMSGNMGVATVGTKMYIFGGYTGSAYLSTIHVFDTETEEITTLSTVLPTNLSNMGVGVVGTKVYIFGGYNGSARLSTIKVFSVDFYLEENTLFLQTNLNTNIFNIVNGIELGVTNVYIGNSDGQGELVDSYLYKNEAWTQI